MRNIATQGARREGQGGSLKHIQYAPCSSVRTTPNDSHNKLHDMNISSTAHTTTQGGSREQDSTYTLQQGVRFERFHVSEQLQ